MAIFGLICNNSISIIYLLLWVYYLAMMADLDSFVGVRYPIEARSSSLGLLCYCDGQFGIVRFGMMVN